MTEAPAGAQLSGQPALEPNRKRRWLLIAAVAWAVLLLVIAYFSVRGDDPTVREQHSIAQASPIVDRALGDIAAAADPNVVVEISGRRVENGCRITPFRDGATLERDITLRTTEADGPALLDRIAQRLPEAYGAGVRQGAGGSKFRADAGEFVGVKGGLTGPGVATFTATTGCRPTVAGFGREPSPAPQIDPEPARLLGALGVPDPAPVARASAPCPGGGSVQTARATGRGQRPGSLAAALRPLAGAGAVVVTDQPEVYAYRTGPLSVVVEATDGEVRVATTTGCPG
jgi:hypothetical protein